MIEECEIGMNRCSLLTSCPIKSGVVRGPTYITREGFTDSAVSMHDCTSSILLECSPQEIKPLDIEEVKLITS